MKTIEQKAKAYDEALEKSKEFYILCKKCGAKDTVDFLEDSFPELRKSEDEMIRKRIIQAIKIREKEMNEEWSNEIAWIEKQGVHANFRHKIQIGDKVTRNKDGILVNISQLDRVAKKHKKQSKQKPVEWKQENREELTEFENAMMHIGGSFFGENAGLDPNDTATIKEQAELLLELAPKTEWSEEDESMRTRCIGILGKCYMGELPTKVEEELNWFKSLKERVQPQPKQEWSMYDETILKTLIDHFEYKKEFNEAEDYDIVLWLKSLKQKVTWKPSDEQMEALEHFIIHHNGSTNYAKDLEELRIQLKKLKGE